MKNSLRENAAAPRQRGVAILLTLILLLMLGAFGITRLVSSGTSIASKQGAENSAQLNIVKTALIAYAMNGRNPAPALCPTTTNARPGELPCPDTTGDGIEECSCSGAQSIGRVPWKTLGIAEPRDASGEPLWYALSDNFRAWTATASPVVINSDTKGGLAVWKDDLSSNLTNEAVAVIIAPGQVVGTQKRAAGTTASCTTTNTVIAQTLCASNYMESSPNGGYNWKYNGPFVMTLATPAAETFNDQLLAVTTSDLIPQVEQRVARDVISLFTQYKANSACQCLPWAAPKNTGAFAQTLDNGYSMSPNIYGYPPLETASPENWGSSKKQAGVTYTIPAMPAYLKNNDWWRVLYYGVGKKVSPSQNGSAIMLNGSTQNTSLVLITPGPAGASRPSTSWSNYIEDSTNIATSTNDNTYITPTSTTYTRDRLYSIPYP